MESQPSFQYHQYYHIYNHANGNDLLFREDDNYFFFLKKLSQYVLPVLKVYSYCLLPNHFHLLVSVKAEDELKRFYINKYPERNAEKSNKLTNLVSNQFRKFFISYSKSYNIMYNRRGSLFEENLKRKHIEKDEYFTNLIRYIHFNPVFHEYVNNPSKWKYSSLGAYLSNKESKISRSEVFEWFGGKEAFIRFHQDILTDEIQVIDQFK